MIAVVVFCDISVVILQIMGIQMTQIYGLFYVRFKQLIYLVVITQSVINNIAHSLTTSNNSY